ncbi:coiled-coil domain-containing protein 30 isoform X2 [Rana temporaria]|uniref:coiled-coil domain-containing protein 30 isoform X2 n=1 Tax=Rana temporaria TaxID=8407 RepID=UPI001AAD66EE|nr:coiled-coil domain-containing protein 30 isoform X2 [Rana temporaria]
MDKVHYEVEDIVNKLEEKGLGAGNSTEEYLTFLWNLYQVAERNLLDTNNSLEALKRQQAEEMKEVESYVAHIRSLTEEREALTTDFEKENVHLRIELEKIQFQQESQLKEVEEMLDQEGLSEISQSSPSEQVAYLLVERATLLEKLEALELKLDSRSENLSSEKRQDELEQIHRTLEEELYQQHESMRRTKENLNKTFDEELEKEKKMRECMERDLNEAAQRLTMAHDEIRKLTDELLIKKKEINELERIVDKKQQDANMLQQELQTQEESDSADLQKAKEHNLRLDKEILALRQRVRALDSEWKKHIEQSEKNDGDSMSTRLNLQDSEELHKKCRLEVEEKECRNKQLLHKLKKLQAEYDDIVERNEELESILGESQNRTKEQVDYLESEIAGLQRTIINLESELTELAEQREDEACSSHRPSSDVKKLSEMEKELAELKPMLKGVQDQLLRAERENNNLRSKNEQLEKEKRFQDNKISELVEQCKKLKLEVAENKLHTNKHLGEGGKDLETEKWSAALSEHQRKCETLQKQIQDGLEEKQHLWEENLQLRQEVTICRQDLQAKREEIARLRQDLFNLQNPTPRPQTCVDGAEQTVSQNKAGDALIQQQFEEIRQLRQDLNRVHNVCSSAEKELRYERDKNLEIKKQNNLLQKEHIKVSEELSHVKQKYAFVTATLSSLEGEREQQQQKIKMMELELMKMSRNSKVQNSWQEKLEHEKCRAVDAEKLVLDLQQQLRATQHQITLLETQIADKRHLEEELKKTREKESKVKMDLQEEQLKRKVLDESLEVLQQEIKTLHEKEISLTESNCALQIKLHQHKSMLQHLDDERKSVTSERTSCESTNHKLLEKLQDMQQEKEQLLKEYDILLKRLDDSIRKYNEFQLRHKAKLSRAKEMYLNELNQKDQHIKQLELELSVSKSQTEKEQQLINSITTLNERLHEEKRRLLLEIAEHEASVSNLKWKWRSLMNRSQILDHENQQLRESVLHLYNQMRSIKQVLKKLQALNLPDIAMMIPSEWLLRTEEMINLPNESFSDLAHRSSPVIKVTEDGNMEQSPENSFLLPVSRSDTSEVGYLNVPSPKVTIAASEDCGAPEPSIDDV